MNDEYTGSKSLLSKIAGVSWFIFQWVVHIVAFACCFILVWVSTMFLVKLFEGLDKLINSFFFEVSLFIKIIIYVIGGTFLFFWRREKGYK